MPAKHTSNTFQGNLELSTNQGAIWLPLVKTLSSARTAAALSSGTNLSVFTSDLQVPDVKTENQGAGLAI